MDLHCNHTGYWIRKYISIYDGFISKELEFDDLKSFLTGKIGRYISQDIKAKQKIGNDYATPEHIYSF